MPDERADLIAKLAAHRDELLATARALADEQAARQPAPGVWSAKQQLSHVARAERLYAACVERVRREDEPDLSSHWAEHREEEAAAANARPLEALLAELASARQETLRLLGALDGSELTRIGRNTPFGDLTIAQLLRSLYRHDRMHSDQIAGRVSSYQPRFVDPPVDRRRPE